MGRGKKQRPASKLAAAQRRAAAAPRGHRRRRRRLLRRRRPGHSNRPRGEGSWWPARPAGRQGNSRRGMREQRDQYSTVEGGCVDGGGEPRRAGRPNRLVRRQRRPARDRKKE